MLFRWPPCRTAASSVVYIARLDLKDILRRHMQADEDLDREVRRHLKHLTENTSTFEIEYQKQLELIKRKHGLD